MIDFLRTFRGGIGLDMLPKGVSAPVPQGVDGSVLSRSVS